jgi:hypothetical protein
MAKIKTKTSPSKSSKRGAKRKPKEGENKDDFDSVIAESKRWNTSTVGYSWSTISLVIALLVSVAANAAQNPDLSSYLTDFTQLLFLRPAKMETIQEDNLLTPIKNPLVTEEDFKDDEMERQRSQPKPTINERHTKMITEDSVPAPDIVFPENANEEVDQTTNNTDGDMEDSRSDAERGLITVQTKETHSNAEVLVSWFRKNGGWMSDNLKLDTFSIGNGLSVVSNGNDDNDVVINEGDEVFRVPEKLQINPRDVIAAWNKTSVEMMILTKDTVKRNCRDKLAQQDIIIALQLMIECAMGEDSLWHPYLQMLPDYVPRMDYFSEQELALMQDKKLFDLAVDSKNNMKNVWKALQENNSWKIFLNAATNTPKPTCLTYEKFHHYTAIVGSRSFILKNIKYLSPVADMVNHMDKGDDSIDIYSLEGEDMFKVGFHKYHKRIASGEIVVWADRNFNVGMPYVEEYGTLDNSLYIQKFGFLQMGNSQNCALIRLPMPTMTETESLLDSLRLNSVTSLCIKKDGTIAFGQQRHGLAYLGIIGLEQLPDQMRKCQGVQGEFMAAYIDASCAMYPGSAEVSSRLIKEAAKSALGSTKTTLAEDLMLLGNFEKGEDLNGMNPIHAIMALQFRIEEKRLLMQVSSDMSRKRIA